MPHSIDSLKKDHVPSFDELFRPTRQAMIGMTPLEARGNRPLQMTLKTFGQSEVYWAEVLIRELLPSLNRRLSRSKPSR